MSDANWTRRAPVAASAGDAIVFRLPAMSVPRSGETAWMDRRLCLEVDPEIFFPEKGESTREAKQVCRGCEVKAECLDYALKHYIHYGIWGGLSENERQALRRRAA